MLSALASEGPARLYGIRVYSESEAPLALVSCPVDNPAELTEEINLQQYGFIRAAACDGSTYYMVTSDDGVASSAFVTLDLRSHRATTVKTYDWKIDTAGHCIFLDMAINPFTHTIYAIGIDFTEAEIVGDDIIADLGLYTIDPATGDASLVGAQGICMLNAICFTNDGDLLGIDANGDVWTIDPRRGRPEENVHSTRVIPNGNQSMVTNPDDDSIYWAAFSTDRNGFPTSQLLRITKNEDWIFDVKNIGNFPDLCELVGLYIDPNPVDLSAPKSVTDFSAMPIEGSAPSARLSWTNPTTDINGTPLSSVDITIFANGEVVNTISAARPGETMTWTHVSEAPAMVTYSILASCNGLDGLEAFADDIYVGADTPAQVKALAAVRNADSFDITISWEAPSTGAHAGLFDASSLTYRVVRRNDGKTIANETSATSVTDSDISATAGYIYEVTACNNAGEGEPLLSAPCLSGPALELPYAMDLDDDNDANMYSVWNLDGDQYTWRFEKNWGGTAERFFRYYPVEIMDREVAVDDWMVSPQFRLRGDHFYALRYEVRLWGDLFPADYAVAIGRGTNPDALTQEIERRDYAINDLEWEQRGVPFSVDADGDYCFGFHALTGNTIDIYKVRLIEIAEKDLAAAEIVGNSAGGVGVASTYTVKVVNEGFRLVDAFTLRLVDDNGVVLASKETKVAIAPQQSAEVEMEWTPSGSGRTNIHALVVLDGDGNNANDLGPAFAVNVNSPGKWADITDGKTLTAYSPFYLQYAHSAAQTIFTAAEINNPGARIEAITYYYTVMGGQCEPFEATISLANTDIDGFDSTADALDASQFTQVFNGTVTIDKSQKSVTFQFDKPYEYSGGNLCVLTTHHSSSVASVIFDALVDKNTTPRTLLYRSDDAPYDFTHIGTFNDRPNISLYFANPSAATATPASPHWSFDSSSGMLRLSGNANVTVWSPQGVCLLSANSNCVDLSKLSGIVIVRIGSEAIRIVI